MFLTNKISILYNQIVNYNEAKDILREIRSKYKTQNTNSGIILYKSIHNKPQNSEIFGQFDLFSNYLTLDTQKNIVYIENKDPP